MRSSLPPSASERHANAFPPSASASRTRPLPARPYLSPVLATAGGAALSCALLLELGWQVWCAAGEKTGIGVAAEELLRAVMPPVLLLAGVAAALVVLLAKARRASSRGEVRSRYLRAFVAGVLIGCACAPVRLCVLAREAGSLAEAPVSAGSLELAGDPSVSTFGVSADAFLVRGGLRVGTVRVSTDMTHPRGTQLHAVGRLKRLGADEWDRALFMRGVTATVDVVAVQSATAPQQPLYALRAAVLGAVRPDESDERALVAGTVCGYSTALNARPISDTFGLTGLSHLVAVSGSHLALVAAFVTRFLERLGASRAACTGVVVVLMLLYVVFTGGAPSAVRSLVMVAAGMGTVLGGRRAHALSALGLTVCALLAANPGLVYDLGFQLSAVSVLFILLFSRYLSCLLVRTGLPTAITELLALTLAAQWGTLPLTLSTFGELSLIAPVANLVVEPPMSALLATGLVCAPLAALSPWLSWLLTVPCVCARASVFLAELLVRVPYAAIAVAPPALAPFALWGAAALVFVTWPDPRRTHMVAGLSAVAASALTWFVVARFCAAPAVTVLDVGQADAVLVRDGGAALLVDSGEDDAALTALARNGVFALDAVVLTHWHSDHAGGLDEIAQLVPVGAVYVPAGAASAAPEEVRQVAGRTTAGRVQELAAGDVLNVGRFTCTVRWPSAPVDGQENEDSLCLEVRYREGDASLTALLTGDAERAVTGAFADAVGDIDVLKLGHHGSAASVDAELLSVLKPEVAVASAGVGNRYGHPSEECRAAVEGAGAVFLCTISAGDVTVRPGAGGIAVQCSGPA